MAGLTPAEAYTVMQGTAGGPQGLTTFDQSGDADAQYTHDCCLLLESSGGCTRSWGREFVAPVAGVDTLQHFIVWVPVPDFTAFPPPPEGEDATLTSLDPATAVVGAPDVTLHVIGTGFDASAVILWGGTAEPTVYVSATELTTIVKPSLASGPGVVAVSVQGPTGTTASQDFTFTEAA